MGWSILELLQAFEQRCFWLPWHHIRLVRRLSACSVKIDCTCSREWAFNHHVGILLPWEKARDFYNDRIN